MSYILKELGGKALKVGIPKGLLYHNYHPFVEKFFNELGAEVITSEETNKIILDEGSKYCVNEACLPIKVFHGHVAAIKDKCDLLLIPRIMSLHEKENICPKFCGLPEMIFYSIKGLPKVAKAPLYIDSPRRLYDWCCEVAASITIDNSKVMKAYEAALEVQKKHKIGVFDKVYKTNIALVGHPYNIYDNYSNMDVIKKLNRLGVGVRTEETLKDEFIDSMTSELFKKPFWTFARRMYGFSTYLAVRKKVDGIIYISSFACGIDSVVIELIKDRLPDFPILILKIDEHTGEAGLNTRIEAFADMLERRC